MESDYTVALTEPERDAVKVALDYYLDTLTLCSFHLDGEHGDESECEGWGPTEFADLMAAAGKIAP